MALLLVTSCPARGPGLTASQPTQGISLVLRFCATIDDTFVTGGDYTLRVWHVNRKRRFITPTNVSISEIKRKIRCATVSDDSTELWRSEGAAFPVPLRLYPAQGLVYYLITLTVVPTVVCDV